MVDVPKSESKNRCRYRKLVIGFTAKLLTLTQTCIGISSVELPFVLHLATLALCLVSFIFMFAGWSSVAVKGVIFSDFFGCRLHFRLFANFSYEFDLLSTFFPKAIRCQSSLEMVGKTLDIQRRGALLDYCMNLPAKGLIWSNCVTTVSVTNLATFCFVVFLNGFCFHPACCTCTTTEVSVANELYTYLFCLDLDLDITYILASIDFSKVSLGKKTKLFHPPLFSWSAQWKRRAK